LQILGGLEQFNHAVHAYGFSLSWRSNHSSWVRAFAITAR
jgi:hypothetical protein